MSGGLRQGMIPSPSIGQPQGMLLNANHPGFMSNSGHMGPQQGLGQGPLGLPQNMSSGPPMSMLSGPPMNPSIPRFTMQSNPMPQGLPQQQRAMVPRQGPNPPQLNPTSANPSAAHIQSQMVGMQLPPGIMQQVGQNNPIRRVQSQPQMNPLGGMPQSASGMTMNQSNQLRQLANQPPGQQPHLQQQHIRMQQFAPNGNMDLMQMRSHNPASSSMSHNIVPRPGPNQGQVMNSLTPSPFPPGMQSQHHQNPFPNGSMPNQAPNSSRPNSTQGMAAGPSHNPANRLRTSPDGSNPMSFMSYGTPSQFSNSNPAARGVAPNLGQPYSFPSTSSPSMQLTDVRQPSPSNMANVTSSQAGNSAAKGGFFPTPAQQHLDMGLDNYSPPFTMPPPPSIPRPPSHGTNPHPGSLPPTPSTPMQNSQQRQQQQHRPPTPQQQAQMAMEQMSQHQSGSHSQPQRPPSQASGSAVNVGPGSTTPGPQQARQPQNQPTFAQGLTAAGRIQQPHQPGQNGPPGSGPQQQHPQGAPLMPILPRPPTRGSMSSQSGPPSMPPPTNLPHGQNAQQQQQSGTAPMGQPQQGPPRPSSSASSPPLGVQNTSQSGRGVMPTTTTAAIPINNIQSALGSGQALMRLIEFSGLLAGENGKKYQLSFWNEMVQQFFTPKALMKLTLWKDNQRNEAKPFEIGVPILPRFFLVTTQSGVKSMTFCLDGARERVREPGHAIVECLGAVWTYKYTNGYTVTLRGPLTVHIVLTATHPPGSIHPTTGHPYSLKFEDFQFDANFHDKFIPLESILGSRSTELSAPPLSNMPMALSAPIPSTQIGGGTHSGKHQGADEDKNWEEPRVLIDHASIPGEPVNAFGIPQATMRCLELAESVTSMVDLIHFSRESPGGPLDALKSFADKLREAGAVLPVPPPPPLQAALPWPIGPSASSPYYPPSSSSINTLYSSASPSLTHPSAPAQSSSPPNTGPTLTNSPDKQSKTIPQQGHPPSGPISSPAISTASNTPLMPNTSLKRKQTGDAGSPIMADQSGKRNTARKRNRIASATG
ncbi:LIM-domain binding protein-domain-containing protein [Crepidotus variabilis]|uniref:LIM-domain binding protein-domain-containing protein n=1 Tax=Crepidotus variabilis TaxID=179855 RepID=A0A9P6EBC7_9AGAR|nr:LIM-domain binding protein-domain-containing protein [Crepidotus variabilis]